MTNKIMINNVDVSGWTLEEIEYHLQHKPKLQMFRAYADIYKQLQAEQQKIKELEEWKKEHLRDVKYLEKHPVIDIALHEVQRILYKQALEELRHI